MAGRTRGNGALIAAAGVGAALVAWPALRAVHERRRLRRLAPDEGVARVQAAVERDDLELLATLATHRDAAVRAAVAAAPEVVERTRLQLAGDAAVEVRLALLEAPDLTVEVIDRLVRDPSPLVVSEALRHPRVPQRFLSAGAVDDEPRVRWGVAMNPATPHRVLLGLLNDAEPAVERAAVANPALPALTQIELASEPARRLEGGADRWRALAMNPRLDPDAATLLAARAPLATVERLIRNPAVTGPTLERVTARTDLAVELRTEAAVRWWGWLRVQRAGLVDLTPVLQRLNGLDPALAAQLLASLGPERSRDLAAEEGRAAAGSVAGR